MNNQQEKKSITNEVLDKIKTGEVKMKSKAYFFLRVGLLMLSALVLSFFVICLISFIIFSLRSSGALFLPSFGYLGIRILFKSLPWFLILTAAALIILLEIFTKRFTFVYRRPIIYSLLAIIIIVILGGLIIDKTSFHSGFFLLSREGRLPLVGPIYRDFGAPKFNNVHYGIVSELIDNGFVIETPRGEKITIIVNSKTRLPIGTDVQKGDIVVVLGERNGDMVEATDIHKTEKNINLFPPDRIRNRPPLNFYERNKRNYL